MNLYMSDKIFATSRYFEEYIEYKNAQQPQLGLLINGY